MALRNITSPAKKMRTIDAPPLPRSEPALLARTRLLLEALRRLSPAEAQELWACSDRLAALNYDRLQRMDLDRDLTAAAVSYEGIQYRHMAPEVMTDGELAWLDEHLRILSGFYGVLRPLDGVTPYRLEMQARLAVGGAHNLYEFWGPDLYDALAAECDLIVNVASVEYSRAVTPWMRPGGPKVLTCLFCVERAGRLRQPATEAKAARGTFIRWCAERGVEDATGLAAFSERGYRLRADDSDDQTLVFVRDSSA